MDSRRFAETMDMLSNAYNRKFYVDEGVLNVWHKFFSDFENDVFDSATVEWIKQNKTPPSISELLSACRILRAQKKRKEAKDRELKNANKGLEKRDIDDPEDDAKHPFEDGWRTNEDGYWIRI